MRGRLMGVDYPNRCKLTGAWAWIYKDQIFLRVTGEKFISAAIVSTNWHVAKHCQSVKVVKIRLQNGARVSEQQ